MNTFESMDTYLKSYGQLLGQNVEQRLKPIHMPGQPLSAGMDTLLRKPFPKQADVITAGVKTLRQQKSLMVIGQMGTGKTLMGQAIAHLHAAGKPYRAIVMAPGQLVKKWARELHATLPGVTTKIVETGGDLLPLRGAGKPTGPEWWIVSRDRAKLGPGWSASVKVRKDARRDELLCPSCWAPATTDKEFAIPQAALEKKKHWCQCGEPLWKTIAKPRRFEPAKYVHKHLRGVFDYFILDEAHEEKGDASAQANAAGALMAACKKVIALTGTLIGGRADHIRTLLLRLAPESLIQEGLGWKAAMPFSERYGRVDLTITEKGGGESSRNRMSRGSSGTTSSKSIKPGIMPTLFGRHLLGTSVYLTLEEVADALPDLNETLVGVPLGALAPHYKVVENTLRQKVKEMMGRSNGGDRRLLGAMLTTLLAYPDYPFNWGWVGYEDKGRRVDVIQPASLPECWQYPKEEAILAQVQKELAEDRQCWIFVQYTETYDVAERLRLKLAEQGIDAAIMRASVKPAEREAWIEKHAHHKVVISHPKLVETGLDFFDKARTYNYCSLMFYETGYNLFTLRQAGARHWRIGQPKECRTFYFYYEGTIQESALGLMGQKMSAAQALEGKFSSEGLVAMSGDDGLELELARSLAENLEATKAKSDWLQVDKPDVIPFPAPRMSKADELRARFEAAKAAKAAATMSKAEQLRARFEAMKATRKVGAK